MEGAGANGMGPERPSFRGGVGGMVDRNLPGSRGVRRVEEANLFFPEEMADLIAEEAKQLWSAEAGRKGRSVR